MTLSESDRIAWMVKRSEKERCIGIIQRLIREKAMELGKEMCDLGLYSINDRNEYVRYGLREFTLNEIKAASVNLLDENAFSFQEIGGGENNEWGVVIRPSYYLPMGFKEDGIRRVDKRVIVEGGRSGRSGDVRRRERW